MDYHLTVQDRFDETRVGLNGNQIVRLNTTVNDGSYDIVRIVSEQVKSDMAAVAESYGKYVVYGVAGLIALRLGSIWWRNRKKRG